MQILPGLGHLLKYLKDTVDCNLPVQINISKEITSFDLEAEQKNIYREGRCGCRMQQSWAISQGRNQSENRISWEDENRVREGGKDRFLRDGSGPVGQ